jgi:phenylacetate-CoA ligase
VSVELAAEGFQGTLVQVESLQARVLAALRDEIGVTPVVRLLEAGSLPASEGKAVRVVDKRQQSGKGCT